MYTHCSAAASRVITSCNLLLVLLSAAALFGFGTSRHTGALETRLSSLLTHDRRGNKLDLFKGPALGGFDLRFMTLHPNKHKVILYHQRHCNTQWAVRLNDRRSGRFLFLCYLSFANSEQETCRCCRERHSSFLFQRLTGPLGICLSWKIYPATSGL